MTFRSEQALMFLGHTLHSSSHQLFSRRNGPTIQERIVIRRARLRPADVTKSLAAARWRVEDAEQHGVRIEVRQCSVLPFAPVVLRNAESRPIACDDHVLTERQRRSTLSTRKWSPGCSRSINLFPAWRSMNGLVRALTADSSGMNPPHWTPCGSSCALK